MQFLDKVTSQFCGWFEASCSSDELRTEQHVLTALKLETKTALV